MKLRTGGALRYLSAPVSNTVILAHRANLRGPHSVVENSLPACAEALREGFGLETDLRRDANGQFYIGHDAQPRTADNALEHYTELFQKFPKAELAINVKELGYEAELIEQMRVRKLGARSFYFDFELLEPDTPGAAQRKLRSLPGGASVRLASRLSDRGENLTQCLGIPAEIVWADEFDSLWLTEREVERVKAAGRLFYVISAEIHGFDHDAMLRRWKDFRAWHVDGVCTDYALEAREFFG
jgi:glycerophosphoryl diester phosphodiesterase